MNGLRELWGKKIGPVPVPVIALVVVVILAVVAWRMKATAGVPTEEIAAVEEETAAAADLQDAEGRIPPFVANPPASGSPVPDTDGQIGQVDSNDQWMRRAIEWLAGQGHATADQATIAMQRYLAGEQLSIAEGRLRDLAISHFGLPPELPESGGTVDPVVTTPVPTTPVPSAPKRYIAPGFHTVTGPSDDSYTDMARLFYGRGDNAAIDLIQSYNVSRGHQGPFPVGTRFWIPKYAAAKYVTATKTMRTAAQIIGKNPPLNSTKMLTELNDGMKFPVAIGTRVRVA